MAPKTQIPKCLKVSIRNIQSYMRRARLSRFWKGQYNEILKLVCGCSVYEQTRRNNIKDNVLVKKISTLPWPILKSNLFELKEKPIRLSVIVTLDI